MFDANLGIVIVATLYLVVVIGGLAYAVWRGSRDANRRIKCKTYGKKRGE